MIDIDKIFFINLDHRTDRWVKLEKDFITLLPDQYQDKVERISGVDLTDREQNVRAAGAASSHLKVWKKCIEEKLDTVLIFEDDVEWAVDKDTINYYFQEFQNLNFDLINFSYRYRDYFLTSKHKDFLHGLDLILCSGYLVKVDFLKKMYNHVYENMLKLLENKPFQDHAIDVVWNKFNFDKENLKINTKWYQTKTKLVIQYENYSDINKAVTDSEKASQIQARFFSCLGDINETI